MIFLTDEDKSIIREAQRNPLSLQWKEAINSSVASEVSITSEAMN